VLSAFIADSGQQLGGPWRIARLAAGETATLRATRLLVPEGCGGVQAARRYLSVGPRVLRTPIQASNANTVAERWIGTVRRERLDHLLITGHGRLLAVLYSYVQQYPP
jgi:hypothetical protein